MHDNRMARLANELQQEIAMIIHQELKDPNLGFVTITRLEMSKDLRHATVLFSCLGDEAQRDRSQEVLDRSAGYIYSLVKKRFRLKVIPELAFRYDASIAGVIELSEKMDRLKGEPPS
ncbi:MAG: 30S ribosome-binding factor RbfA [Candidatus Omnitrophica bacterium]|nr:30S ribosome-binding factor RbfA [Candidatus Omnitrophota bacterium]